MTAPEQPPLIDVVARRAYASRRDVIEAIGGAMVASGAVTRSYVDGMLRKEDQACTIVTDDVALPHGTPDVKHAVLRNALVVAPIPDGIEWAPGRRVRLAIGFAGANDRAHLRLMAAVARVLSDEQMVMRLTLATQPDDIADVLRELGR